MTDLTPEAWTKIRTDYEHTERPIADICAEHGISDGTLRLRVRRWNWTRRRLPIPSEGPPALAPVHAGIAAGFPLPACGERSAAEAERGRPGEGALPNAESGANPPHPISSLGPEINLSPQAGRGEQAALSPQPIADAAADPAAVAARLQGAANRVLPAIEAIIARMASAPLRPREMEQSARALGVLTRTLRELTALLAKQPVRLCDCGGIPDDIDEFRYELARRIRALVDEKQRAAAEAQAAADGATPAEP